MAYFCVVMSKSILIFLLLILFNGNDRIDSLDGYYSGLEKLCWETDKNGNCINTTEMNPGFKWYHENKILIKGDNIFMDQNPLSIATEDQKKYYSASDGGFYYYSGKITKKDKLYYFDLTQLYCDYCPEEVVKQPDGSYKKVEKEIKKQLTGKIVDGKLVIDGNTYIKIQPKFKLNSESYKPKQ